MERNKNKHQIVMAIENYEKLVAMANQSNFNTNKIERHVRKFNPFLQKPHQERVRTEEAVRSRLIRETRKYFETHVGKVVYARVDMLGNALDPSTILIPVIVKRINKDRWSVDVQAVKDKGHPLVPYSRVTIGTLFDELPEGYVHGAGPFTNLWVLNGSAYCPFNDKLYLVDK